MVNFFGALARAGFVLASTSLGEAAPSKLLSLSAAAVIFFGLETAAAAGLATGLAAGLKKKGGEEEEENYYNWVTCVCCMF